MKVWSGVNLRYESVHLCTVVASALSLQKSSSHYPTSSLIINNKFGNFGEEFQPTQLEFSQFQVELVRNQFLVVNLSISSSRSIQLTYYRKLPCHKTIRIHPIFSRLALKYNSKQFLTTAELLGSKLALSTMTSIS